MTSLARFRNHHQVGFCNLWLILHQLWQILGGDVMWAINSFFSWAKSSFRLSAVLTVFSWYCCQRRLKRREAKDYRPNALIHSFAKLLSKLLANRLAPRVPDTIGSNGNQSFRIKGRLILDNYKFVRCAAALFKKKKIPKLLFKLDHIQSSRYFFLAFSSGCFKSKGIQW